MAQAIKSTKPIKVNNRTGEMAEIHYRITEQHVGVINTKNGEVEAVSYMVQSFYINKQSQLIMLEAFPVHYRKTVFMKLYGKLSIEKLEETKYDIFINTIDFLNSREFNDDSIQVITYHKGELTSKDFVKVG